MKQELSFITYRSNCSDIARSYVFFMCWNLSYALSFEDEWSVADVDSWQEMHLWSQVRLGHNASVETKSTTRTTRNRFQKRTKNILDMIYEERESRFEVQVLHKTWRPRFSKDPLDHVERRFSDIVVVSTIILRHVCLDSVYEFSYRHETCIPLEKNWQDGYWFKNWSVSFLLIFRFDECEKRILLSMIRSTWSMTINEISSRILIRIHFHVLKRSIFFCIEWFILEIIVQPLNFI